MPLAIFGLSSGGLTTAIWLIVLFLAATYVALVWWTYLDARRRIEDPLLIGCSAVASLVFPFLGTIVYTIVRPPEFLEDRRERDLELRASELRLRELIEQACPFCEYPIERNYLRCPNCERRVKEPCRKCRKPLDPKWGICPYCETQVRKRGEPSALERTSRLGRDVAMRRERERERERERAGKRPDSGARPGPGPRGTRQPAPPGVRSQGRSPGGPSSRGIQGGSDRPRQAPAS